jgi:hypothetical protein
MDLLATYNVTRHLQVYAGYSHFFTGEFIRKTGPSRDSDFLYGAIIHVLSPTGVVPEAPCTCRRTDGTWVPGVGREDRRATRVNAAPVMARPGART